MYCTKCGKQIPHGVLCEDCMRTANAPLNTTQTMVPVTMKDVTKKMPYLFRLSGFFVLLIAVILCFSSISTLRAGDKSFINEDAGIIAFFSIWSAALFILDHVFSKNSSLTHLPLPISVLVYGVLMPGLRQIPGESFTGLWILVFALIIGGGLFCQILVKNAAARRCAEKLMERGLSPEELLYVNGIEKHRLTAFYLTKMLSDGVIVKSYEDASGDVYVKINESFTKNALENYIKLCPAAKPLLAHISGVEKDAEMLRNTVNLEYLDPMYTAPLRGASVNDILHIPVDSIVRDSNRDIRKTLGELDSRIGKICFGMTFSSIGMGLFPGILKAVMGSYFGKEIGALIGAMVLFGMFSLLVSIAITAAISSSAKKRISISVNPVYGFNYDKKRADGACTAASGTVDYAFAGAVAGAVASIDGVLKAAGAKTSGGGGCSSCSSCSSCGSCGGGCGGCGD